MLPTNVGCNRYRTRRKPFEKSSRRHVKRTKRRLLTASGRHLATVPYYYRRWPARFYFWQTSSPTESQVPSQRFTSSNARNEFLKSRQSSSSSREWARTRFSYLRTPTYLTPSIDNRPSNFL